MLFKIILFSSKSTKIGTNNWDLWVEFSIDSQPLLSIKIKAIDSDFKLNFGGSEIKYRS